MKFLPKTKSKALPAFPNEEVQQVAYELFVKLQGVR
jgi:hypothetical protein